MKMKFFQWLKDTFMEDSIPTAEALARRYREMPDTAFNQLNPKDLTPIARACYEAEAELRAANKRPAVRSRIA